jgi:hypothetical protein
MIGAGAGAATMFAIYPMVFGKQSEGQGQGERRGPPAGMFGDKGGMFGDKGGFGKAGPGKGGFGKGGFGKGPGPKFQLVTLINKLDLLTGKPLTLNLDATQKEQIGKQLEGLELAEELSNEQAKERLDAVLAVLKDQRETLEAAGYIWPGKGGGFKAPPALPGNPFREEGIGQQLQSLRAHLKKAAP